MKAAVLCDQPGDLEIENLRIDAPGPNEVLIQTMGAGLCHSDLHFMEGLFRTPLPMVMGHESAGVVEAAGSDVSYVAPGDHVVACLSIFCGQCRRCLSARIRQTCAHYLGIRTVRIKMASRHIWTYLTCRSQW